MANKTLQLKRKSTKYASLEATLTAMSAATISEGELFVGYYEADGEDHAVLGLGGVNGTPKLFFFDGAEIESQIEAAITGLVDGASTSANTLSKLEGLINGLSQDAATYTIVSGTPTESNVKEVYQLQQTVNGTATNVGLPIKIYKDSSLYSVYLGHVDDTITSPSNPTVVPGTGSEALCFIYLKADATYELVSVDVESFLQESEFKDGLQVVNHEVSVKLDNEAGTDSAKFLYMKEVPGGNGAIALSGITDAITAAVEDLDATVSGSSTHVNVTVTETDGKITNVAVTNADIASANDLSTEIAGRRAQTGISGDAYVANSGTIISGATSLNNADVILAQKVAELDAAQISIEKGASSESFLDITKSGTVYTVTVSGITSAINSAIEDLDASEVGGTGKYLTTISESNGTISATAADLNAAAVAATPITAGNDTVAVTGTTVEAQISSLAKTAKGIQNDAYSGVTSANAAINAGAVTNNGQVLTFQLDTTTATNNITSDILDVTNNGLRMKDTFDCGTW
jgi:hypothetical protein